MQFKQGDVFLRKNAVHSFENALLGGCHFSRGPQIGLMSVARFSWVPNLYNIHFLVENRRPQPDPVNCHRVQSMIQHHLRMIFSPSPFFHLIFDLDAGLRPIALVGPLSRCHPSVRM